MACCNIDVMIARGEVLLQMFGLRERRKSIYLHLHDYRVKTLLHP